MSPSQCLGAGERHAPAGWGLSRGKEAGPGSPLRLPQWRLCPLLQPAQPQGAEVSNSSYAAWPVYLGVST